MNQLELTKKSLNGLWVGDCIGNIGQLYFAQDILKALDEGLAKFGDSVNPAGQHFHLSDDTEEAIVLVNHLNDNSNIIQDKYAFEIAKRFFERDPDGEIYGYGLMTRTVLKDIYLGKDWKIANQTKPRVEGPSFVDNLIGGIANGKSITQSMAEVNSDLQKELLNKPELKIGSCGNGSAMRVAPLGAFAFENNKTLEWLIEQATLQSQVTHCHPEGIAGSIAVAVLAYKFAKLNVYGNKIIELRGHWEPKDLYNYVLSNTPVGKVYDGIKIASELPLDLPLMKVIELIGNGTHVTCQDTVPLCIYLSIKSLFYYSIEELYEKTIIETCKCFGDVDTNCAIVGGIVGIFSVPPTKWIGYCEPMEGLLGDVLPPGRKIRQHSFNVDKNAVKEAMAQTKITSISNFENEGTEYEYSEFTRKTPPDFEELLKKSKKQ